jgi:3-oxoacyl-[acyl-carrier protein] reductase
VTSPHPVDRHAAGEAEGASTADHTAIVTGANHGIGAATAELLAERGCAVLCSFLRVDDQPDPGIPQAYRDHRAQDAAAVVARIRASGGRAVAVEADLSDPTVPAMLFDVAEEQLGPVDILVNNATGWLADTFTAQSADRHGRSLVQVSAATWEQQFRVDAMAAALMISEYARRHRARGADWGRIIGLTSGGDLGFPEEVSYGAAKAAQTNYTMSAAMELAPSRPGPHRQPGGRGGCDRLPRLRRRGAHHGQRHTTAVSGAGTAGVSPRGRRPRAGWTPALRRGSC